MAEKLNPASKLMHDMHQAGLSYEPGRVIGSGAKKPVFDFSRPTVKRPVDKRPAEWNLAKGAGQFISSTIADFWSGYQIGAGEKVLDGTSILPEEGEDELASELASFREMWEKDVQDSKDAVVTPPADDDTEMIALIEAIKEWGKPNEPIPESKDNDTFFTDMQQMIEAMKSLNMGTVAMAGSGGSGSGDYAFDWNVYNPPMSYYEGDYEYSEEEDYSLAYEAYGITF